MWSRSSVSPVWATCTLAGSTPSSSKIRICSSPVPLAGREWAMIGRPVCMDARAAARWIFSMFGVTPGSSAAHLMKAGLIPVPWIPCSISWTKMAATASSSRLRRNCGRWS